MSESVFDFQAVSIRGEAAESANWLQRLSHQYAPRRMVVAVPAEATGLPDALAGKSPRERTVAYVCRGPVCSEPKFELEELALSAAQP